MGRMDSARAKIDFAPTHGINTIIGYNTKIHHRKSIRLNGYDYSQAGSYFVTICCQNRAHFFGEMINGKMTLNDAGKMIEKIWHEIPDDFKNIHLKEYVTMPNHIHGIIEIPVTVVGADSISAHSISSQNPNKIYDENRAEMDSAPTMTTGTGTKMKPGLSQIIQSFKRHTTIEYIKMVKQNILPFFDKRIWQRNCWEHIIRNENEFIRISEYIRNNPVNWDMDKLNDGVGNIVMESSSPYNEENWMV